MSNDVTPESYKTIHISNSGFTGFSDLITCLNVKDECFIEDPAISIKNK